MSNTTATLFDLVLKMDGETYDTHVSLSVEQIENLVGRGLGLDKDNKAENEFYAKLEAGESATLKEDADPRTHSLLKMLGVPTSMETIATVVS